MQLAGVARVERALGDVDVQQTVGVGQLSGHNGAARDGQRVSAGAERDIARDCAVADVQHIGAGAQADLALDGRFLAVRHAVLVGIGQFRARYDDAVLDEGDARGALAEIDGDGLAGLVDIGRGANAGGDHARVAEAAQRAGVIPDRHGIGLGAADARSDLTGIFK
ncbi:hypothetical protein D3C87_1428290 [compost metagenome]